MNSSHKDFLYWQRKRETAPPVRAGWLSNVLWRGKLGAWEIGNGEQDSIVKPRFGLPRAVGMDAAVAAGMVAFDDTIMYYRLTAKGAKEVKRQISESGVNLLKALEKVQP